MTSRRVFIKSASALSAAVFVKGPLTAFATPVIGLQLYTVRDAMGTDPLGTLQKVSRDWVQFSGKCNLYRIGEILWYGCSHLQKSAD